MDSLTQIVLGAAVGEAVLGRKIGNKAMLYGAVAGTIPDLDVFASHFTDEVSALQIHRGFTHSIVFSVFFGGIFAWIVTKYEKLKEFKPWFWLFFLCFVTHSLLDVHTTWGTQLFWPFNIRLAFKSIFVIDPVYTLPFLCCVLFAMLQKRTSDKRRKYNNLGLLISSSYLFLTLILKGITYKKFENALKNQEIEYSAISTRPAPLNTILWNANVDTKDAYLVGSYSFFDTKPITFYQYPKNHKLLGDLIINEKVQEMITISQGWYTISEKNDQLYFNDLRFGTLSLQPNAQNFVFQFLIKVDENNNVTFIEQKKDRRDAKKLLSELWQRIKGN